MFISVVTIAKLRAGVLAASDTATRARRMATLHSVADLWIAAVAAANGMAVVTQDFDYDPLEAVDGPGVIRV